MRQLKVVAGAQALTWERISLRVQLPPHQCVTFGMLLDLNEPQFSFVLNGHDSCSSLIQRED